TNHLHVHLGHQWASGIEHFESAPLGLVLDRFGDAVGTENDNGVIGNLIEFLDKHGATLTQAIHHIAVMNHFMANIDGWPEHVQGTVDDFNGAVDARAETTRVGKTDLHNETCGSEPSL